MHPILGSVIASSVVAVAFVGCNSILDNQPGELVVGDKSSALPSPTSTGSTAGAATSPDAGDNPSSGCATGQQMCFGSCVSLTDPLYGCGDPTCAPCPSGHSTMGCQGRRCIVMGCDPGYADCNNAAADGCETDLSKAASCGACNASCGVGSPLCTPVGATFQCTNGCTPAAPLKCGTSCVDPSTSTSHCGGCNVACPVVPNGTTACAAGACKLTCKTLFHACAGACVAQTDPTACGPACTACPVPVGGVATCVADVCGVTCTAPNRLCAGSCAAESPTSCGAACTVCPVPAAATATCTASVCGFTCTAGFGNCDANAANGCEANLDTDPANCGGCGKPCAAPKVCTAGACH